MDVLISAIAMLLLTLQVPWPTAWQARGRVDISYSNVAADSTSSLTYMAGAWTCWYQLQQCCCWLYKFLDLPHGRRVDVLISATAMLLLTLQVPWPTARQARGRAWGLLNRQLCLLPNSRRCSDSPLQLSITRPSWITASHHRLLPTTITCKSRFRYVHYIM